MTIFLLLEAGGQGMAVPLHEYQAFGSESPQCGVMFEGPSPVSAIRQSAEHGARLAQYLLQREGYRDLFDIAFSIGKLPTAINGRSTDLAFALATLVALRPQQQFPNFAATGELDSTRIVQGVGGLPAKLKSVMDELPARGVVFYPKANDDDLDADVRRLARERSVELFPVRRMEEAARRLGIEVLEVWLESPYRGLESFSPQHRAIFFGRDTERKVLAEQLMERERQNRPGVLVLAASGTGKSSFVQAGLIPYLQDNYQDLPLAYSIWRPSMATGRDQAALCASIRGNWVQAKLPFSFGSLTLPESSDLNLLCEDFQHWRPSPVRWLWVVDQFEEIFTLGFDSSAVQAFALLLNRLQGQGVWVVGTLRSEFYGDYQGLKDGEGNTTLLDVFDNGGQYNLRSIQPEGLRQVIEKPAEAAEIEFESRDGVSLADRIREDMVGALDALPLLEYTLSALYQLRDLTHQRLTFSAYEALGGLKGAISEAAETAFKSLPASAQNEFPRLIRGLVRISSEAQLPETARPVGLSLFPTATPGRDLVNGLVQARLLVIDTGAEEQEIRLSHEALLTHWVRAREVLDASRQDMLLRERVAARAMQWNQENRHADRLLKSNIEIGEARYLKERLRNDLVIDPSLNAFINQSLASHKNRKIKLAAIILIFSISLSAITIEWWLKNKETISLQEREITLVQKNLEATTNLKNDAIAARIEAEKAKKNAVDEKDNATTQRVRAILRLARQAFDQGRQMTTALISLELLKFNIKTREKRELEALLQDSYLNIFEKKSISIDTQETIEESEISPKWKLILTREKNESYAATEYKLYKVNDRSISPSEVDLSYLVGPGKYTFKFSSDERYLVAADQKTKIYIYSLTKKNTEPEVVDINNLNLKDRSALRLLEVRGGYIFFDACKADKLSLLGAIKNECDLIVSKIDENPASIRIIDSSPTEIAVHFFNGDSNFILSSAKKNSIWNTNGGREWPELISKGSNSTGTLSCIHYDKTPFGNSLTGYNQIGQKFLWIGNNFEKIIEGREHPELQPIKCSSLYFVARNIAGNTGVYTSPQKYRNIIGAGPGDKIFSGDGFLASAKETGEIYVYMDDDIFGGKFNPEVHPIPLHGHNGKIIAISGKSGDKLEIATVAKDKTFKVWGLNHIRYYRDTPPDPFNAPPTVFSKRIESFYGSLGIKNTTRDSEDVRRSNESENRIYPDWKSVVENIFNEGGGKPPHKNQPAEKYVENEQKKYSIDKMILYLTRSLPQETWFIKPSVGSFYQTKEPIPLADLDNHWHGIVYGSFPSIAIVNGTGDNRLWLFNQISSLATSLVTKDEQVLYAAFNKKASTLVAITKEEVNFSAGSISDRKPGSINIKAWSIGSQNINLIFHKHIDDVDFKKIIRSMSPGILLIPKNGGKGWLILNFEGNSVEINPSPQLANCSEPQSLLHLESKNILYVACKNMLAVISSVAPWNILNSAPLQLGVIDGLVVHKSENLAAVLSAGERRLTVVNMAKKPVIYATDTRERIFAFEFGDKNTFFAGFEGGKLLMVKFFDDKYYVESNIGAFPYGVEYISYSADKKIVFACDIMKMCREWKIEEGEKLIKAAKNVLTRQISEEERRQFELSPEVGVSSFSVLAQ